MSNVFTTIKFKCRDCQWIGTESQMKYADNGSDYSEYCPVCGDQIKEKKYLVVFIFNLKLLKM